MSKKKKNDMEKSVQDLVPVRGIYSEMIETTDNRFVKVLSVTSVNIQLMSYSELKEVFFSYESFLKTLDRPIQIARVSQPIDLKDYIMDLKKRLKTTENPYKRHMLKSFISYAQKQQEDRDMIRRSRYVIISESFSDEKSKDKAMQILKTRVQDLKFKLEEMLYRQKLEVSELTNEELRKCIHMFFDYEHAQLHSMSEDDAKEYSYMIGKRNLMDAAEMLKKKEDWD
ncbi:hypothetical protein SAMN04487866_12245 [Thermoactinomyces sp. DSM 45891]|uniref:hypothetical protein n=1 Tax=Thermoactinomyces sp. DSM 45891 TaxID=1761907 RepID=UPI00091DDF61|nr:hypothetical protein [Thermoactinomyces sp. DSM 45891]SFX75321.1 hypothetical protein SAMN04487866_12245 [Thermoactinomyces sp. DSM 45891]